MIVKGKYNENAEKKSAPGTIEKISNNSISGIKFGSNSIPELPETIEKNDEGQVRE